MTLTADRPAEFVEALSKGIAILEAFDAAHPAMTLSELARRVRVSPAATRRSLITLSALGYVGQRDKRFHLTTKVMSLASGFHAASCIDEILQPAVRGLVERFGDASSIGTLLGGDVLYIAHHSIQRARRAVAVVGARYPVYATSMGRVLLAGQDDERIDAYIATCEPQKLTSFTCTNRKAFRAEVMVARRDGYATTVDQLDYGITALAVPIRDAEGRTVAALNTSGYTGMVTPERLIEERLPELRAVAAAVGHELIRNPMLMNMIAS